MLGYFIFDLFCLVRSFSVSCVIWLYPERDGGSEKGRVRCKFGILLFVLVSIYISELFRRVCVFWLEKKALKFWGEKKKKFEIPELFYNLGSLKLEVECTLMLYLRVYVDVFSSMKFTEYGKEDTDTVI